MDLFKSWIFYTKKTFSIPNAALEMKWNKTEWSLVEQTSANWVWFLSELRTSSGPIQRIHSLSLSSLTLISRCVWQINNNLEYINWGREKEKRKRDDRQALFRLPRMTSWVNLILYFNILFLVEMTAHVTEMTKKIYSSKMFFFRFLSAILSNASFFQLMMIFKNSFQKEFSISIAK